MYSLSIMSAVHQQFIGTKLLYTSRFLVRYPYSYIFKSLCKFAKLTTYVPYNPAVDNMLINTYIHMCVHICIYTHPNMHIHTVRQIYNFIFIPLQGSIMWLRCL